MSQTDRDIQQERSMVAEKSRGELGELRSQLTRLSGGGSSPEKIAQKREVFRKVIMLGTIGQDMSSLFMQVKADMRLHTSTRHWALFPGSPADLFQEFNLGKCRSRADNINFVLLCRSSPVRRQTRRTSC